MNARKQLIIMNHAHNRDQPEIQVKSQYKARKPSYVCSYTWLCSLQACSNNKYIVSRVMKLILFTLIIGTTSTQHKRALQKVFHQNKQ